MFVEPALVSLLSSEQCRSPNGFLVMGEGPVQGRMIGTTVVSSPKPTPGAASSSLPASVL